MVIRADLVAKGILLWILTVIFVISIFIHHSDSPFFRFGPNDQLHIFTIAIDSAGKYIWVVSYTLCSTIIRSLQEELLAPWIIQNIQNDHEKTDYTRKHAYEIVLIDRTYRWFDWFMYMNILLSQIDMMLIETLGNLILAFIITHYYLHRPMSLSTIPTI